MKYIFLRSDSSSPIIALQTVKPQYVGELGQTDNLPQKAYFGICFGEDSFGVITLNLPIRILPPS